MCEIAYEMTYTDLNPRFLFSFIQTKTEASSPHTHEDFIELAVILKGRGRFVIQGKEYLVGEGDLILLNPGTEHYSYSETGNEQPYTECLIGFTNVDYQDCCKGHMPLFKGYQMITHMPDAVKKEIFQLCMKIDQESNNCELGRYFMLKSYLIQVLCQIARFQKQEYEKEVKMQNAGGCSFHSINKKYIIDRITAYMEKNYKEKISLDQIADNMYLSSYYISKLFKSETGDTPINYLISLRMKKAKEMLDEQPERSIQSIAAAVGYDDAYHFSKLFKKYYGIAPLYYKARLPQ